MAGRAIHVTIERQDEEQKIPPKTGRRAGAAGRRHWLDLGLSVLTFVVILSVWELTVRGLRVSSAVFPTASAVGISLYENIMDGTYLKHFWTTFAETMLGFFLGSTLGAVLGILIAEVHLVRRLLYPYVVMFQSVPKTALAPLFLIWFGFGIESKVALATSATFFPVLVNIVAGIAGTDELYIRLLRAYSASRWEIFRRVKLPSALPFLFAGLQIAIVLSVISAVVSEFLGSTAGLGFLVYIYNIQLNTAGEFAGLIVLALMGYLLSTTVQWASRKVVFWQEEPERKLGI